MIPRSLLVYTENYDPGGGNRYLRDFIAALPAGAEVTVASNRGAFFEGDREAMARVSRFREVELRSVNIRSAKASSVVRLGGSSLARRLFDHAQRIPGPREILMLEDAWFNRGVLGALLDSGRWDAVLVFNGGFPAALSCFDLAVEARRRRIPVVMVVVSMPAPRSVVDRLMAHSYRAVDKYVVNAAAIARDLSVSRSIPMERISVLHNSAGVDAGEPRSRRGDKGCAFGYVGRVQRAKGVFELVRAFSVLRLRYPDATLKLFGKVYERGELEALISSLGLQGSVELAGFFDSSVDEVLSGFDVFVFPSRWEGFPYSLLEAMRAGLPVISTDVGGIPELIRDGENGFLVPRRRPWAFAQAMARLAADEPLRERLGNAARETIRREFLFARFERQVQEILADLMKEHK